jgi:hypothetical protein
MNYKTGCIVQWKGPDGILLHDKRYTVSAVRKGKREEEFTLEGVRHDSLSPIWWECGKPFAVWDEYAYSFINKGGAADELDEGVMNIINRLPEPPPPQDSALSSASSGGEPVIFKR